MSEWLQARVRMASGRTAAAVLQQMLGARSDQRIQRFGTEYGGWPLCVDALEPEGIALCVGAGEDVSFDVALNARFGMRVVCVDPTPRALTHVGGLLANHAHGRATTIGGGPTEYALDGFDAERFELVPWALWSADTELRFYVPRDARHVSHSAVNLQNTSDFIVVPAVRISTLLQRFNVARIALLKLDVEGAEYEILRDLLASDVRPTQLLVEFEDVNHPRSPAALVRLARAVRAVLAGGYDLIYRERSSFLFLRAERQDGKG